MYHLRWSIISFLEICGCHRSRAVTRQQKVINSWPRICSQAGVCPLADEAQSDIIWLLAWVLHQWRHDGFYRTCVCCLTELRHTGDPGDRKSYLIRYDALVGRPPAPRLPPCVQVVCSNMAETGNLTERERGVKSEPSSVSFLPAAVGGRCTLLPETTQNTTPLHFLLSPQNDPAAHLQPRADSEFTSSWKPAFTTSLRLHPPSESPHSALLETHSWRATICLVSARCLTALKCCRHPHTFKICNLFIHKNILISADHQTPGNKYPQNKSMDKNNIKIY